MTVPSGTLANGLTSGNSTPDKVYTLPTVTTLKYGVLSVMVLNVLTDTTDTRVEIYIGNGNTPAVQNMIEIASLKPDGGKVVVNCNCMSPGDSFFVKSSKPGLVFRVEGVFEEEQV